jgi:hypothetical protein
MKVIFIYLIPFISLIGFILNMICFIIYSDREFKESLYKYLKVESIFISMNLFMQLFRPFEAYRIGNLNSINWSSKSYLAQFFEFYCLNFLASVFEMTALMLHLISSFNYYILLSYKPGSSFYNKLKLLEKVSYIKITIIFTLFSILAFLFQIFQYDLVAVNIIMDKFNLTENEHRIAYFKIESGFYNTPLSKFLTLFWFSFRDGFILLLLFILNIFIYFEANYSFRKKFSFFMASSNSTDSLSVVSNNKLKSRDNKAQIKLAIMVIATSMNFFVGRFPILLAFILKNTENGWTRPVKISMDIGCLTVFVSYPLFFYHYFFFNKRFRTILFRYFDKKTNK